MYFKIKNILKNNRYHNIKYYLNLFNLSSKNILVFL